MNVITLAQQMVAVPAAICNVNLHKEHNVKLYSSAVVGMARSFSAKPAFRTTFLS